MGFRSESTIGAPRAAVWDTVEMGWYEASGDPLRRGSSMEAQIEIPELIPEALRRKLGDSLIVNIQITELGLRRAVGARVISTVDSLPRFDLRLQLEEDNERTHALLQGDMDTRGSWGRKASGALLAPVLGRLAAHGMNSFAEQAAGRYSSSLPEAS